MEFIANILIYALNNAFGFIVFVGIALLAIKSDVFKDLLSLGLIALLLIPVPCVIYMHITNDRWISAVVCISIQVGLTYLSYKFICYMFKYHKENKYILWEK